MIGKQNDTQTVAVFLHGVWVVTIWTQIFLLYLCQLLILVLLLLVVNQKLLLLILVLLLVLCYQHHLPVQIQNQQGPLVFNYRSQGSPFFSSIIGSMEWKFLLQLAIIVYNELPIQFFYFSLSIFLMSIFLGLIVISMYFGATPLFVVAYRQY